MGQRKAGRLARVALIAAALAGSAALSGCSLFGASRFEVLQAFTTVTDGIAAAINGTQTSAPTAGANPNTGPAGTYVYSASGGAVVFSITSVTGASGAPEPSGGSFTYSGYSVSNGPYSVSGTLTFTVNPSATSTSNTAPVALSGTLELSGGALTSLDCTLSATGGPTQFTSSQVQIYGFGGTLVAQGKSYDVDKLYQ